MHRSGTSCLAGCLEERGLDLGDVVNAAPHNRKGNKENLEIRQINDDVLALSGGAWDSPPKRLKWDANLRRRRNAHIDARFAKGDDWGFKDPRTLLTLPFWLEANVEMRFVGTFRHPAAVATSLLGRPGLVPARSPYALWTEYNRRLLDHVNAHATPLINFDWPAPRYHAAVIDLADSLGLTSSSPTSFFDATLRVRSATSTGTAEAESVEALALYEELAARTAGAGAPMRSVQRAQRT
jgi:hypothetical protein